MPIIVAAGYVYFLLHQSEKNKVPFSTDTGTEELVHKCFRKHLGMGKSRMKYDKETDEGKKGRMSMERSKTARKK